MKIFGKIFFGLMLVPTVLIVGVLTIAVATHGPSSKTCYAQSILDARRMVELGQSKFGVHTTATMLSIERDCARYN